MLTALFKKLFGESGSSSAEESIDYKGFTITPEPRKANGGFGVGAIITKEIDGVALVHQFIRADAVATREGCVELTLNKARQTIDQMGDSIFTPR